MNTLEYIMSKKARSDISDLLIKNGKHTQSSRLENVIIPKPLYKYSSINKHILKNLQENITFTLKVRKCQFYFCHHGRARVRGRRTRARVRVRIRVRVRVKLTGGGQVTKKFGNFCLHPRFIW